MSGCSKGLIIHWDMDTAELIHDYGEFEGGVIKLGSAGLLVVALLTDCIRVWDCIEGGALHKISLVRFYMYMIVIIVTPARRSMP